MKKIESCSGLFVCPVCEYTLSEKAFESKFNIKLPQEPGIRGILTWRKCPECGKELMIEAVRGNPPISLLFRFTVSYDPERGKCPECGGEMEYHEDNGYYDESHGTYSKTKCRGRVCYMKCKKCGKETKIEGG